MNDNYIRVIIEKAYGELLKNDLFLLQNDLNERTLTHRLAIYLEKYFPDYHVDCEYNRDGVGISQKSLDGLRQKINELGLSRPVTNLSEDTDAMTVYPDIIIHKRGLKEGFVVIEAKKSTNSAGYDRAKLQLYKSERGYKHAYFVTFPVGKEAIKKPNYSELIEQI